MDVPVVVSPQHATVGVGDATPTTAPKSFKPKASVMVAATAAGALGAAAAYYFSNEKQPEAKLNTAIGVFAASLLGGLVVMPLVPKSATPTDT